MASNDVPVEKCMASYPYSFDKNILKDKVAFITGGGSGICFTIAEVFMRHGCRTAIAGRKIDRLNKSAETLTNATGVKCLPVQLDVRKPADVIKAVDSCMQEFGRIDILVNGAAGNFLCPLENMSFNAFKTVIEIDTLGTFNVSKVVFEKAMKDKGGVILNITANIHLRGNILQAHVGSAKAGIEYLTRHQAIEWGPHGVRVVCVAPGPIKDTEGMRRLAMSSDEEINRRIPIRRQGSKQEIGEICLFLATPMAGLITSSSIQADGAAWMASGNEDEMLQFYKKFAARM